jgi:hypothetical protein
MVIIYNIAARVSRIKGRGHCKIEDRWCVYSGFLIRRICCLEYVKFWSVVRSINIRFWRNCWRRRRKFVWRRKQPILPSHELGNDATWWLEEDCSGMLHRVVWYNFTDVSEVLTASIIRAIAVLPVRRRRLTSVNVDLEFWSTNPLRYVVGPVPSQRPLPLSRVNTALKLGRNRSAQDSSQSRSGPQIHQVSQNRFKICKF